MVSYKRLLVICVVATAMMALMGCAKNGTGDDILPSVPTFTDTEKVSSPTGSITEKLSLTPLPGSTSTPAPTSTPKQTSTPAPTPKSTSTPTLTPPPAQVVAISPSPKPTSEDWWKTYDFLQGDNGEILPEAIKPDISVAYKVTEDDYSVVPEDIKGMFTKENFPRVDGSTATIPISEAIYQYATGATEEEAQNAIVHTKTSQSYYKLFNKESDILIVYEPADTVVEMMKDNPCIIKPIGLDALVFMANTNNPVDSLTLGQLQRIFTGQLDNWTQVGGDDKPLIAFQRPQGTGSQNLIEKVVMGDLPVRSDNSVTVFYAMDGILEGLLSYNGEDNALGYSVYYYAHNMYYLPELKFMAVDGVLPSVQTISDGSYSLVNPFYAVIRADEPEDSDAHKLFDWLTGETAQQMMMDLGYVPVKIPENAEFGDFQTYGKGNAEVSATRDLKEGEYFIYFNEGPLKSSDDSFSYGTVGDMIIFDHKWDPVMTFYNVSIDEEYYGINTSGKLLINQLRWESYGKDGKAGKYLLRSGYYDINSEKYLWQIDGTLEVLDKERERFVGGGGYVLDGNGEVLIDGLGCYEGVSIWKTDEGYINLQFPGRGSLEFYQLFDFDFKQVKNYFDCDEYEYYHKEKSDDYGKNAIGISSVPFDSGIQYDNFEDKHDSAEYLRVVSENEYVRGNRKGAVLYIDEEPVLRSENDITGIYLENGAVLWRTFEDKVLQYDGEEYNEPLKSSDWDLFWTKRYRYCLTKNGKVVLKNDHPTFWRYLEGGYIQDVLGEYNTVYDMDGNIIIRRISNRKATD